MDEERPANCPIGILAQHLGQWLKMNNSPSSPLGPTTQRRSRLQHGYCIGVSRRSAQATVSNGLAQGPYVAARVGVEPTTLQLKVIDSTKAPPRTMNAVCALVTKGLQVG